MRALRPMSTADEMSHVVAIDDLEQSVVLPTEIKAGSAPINDGVYLHERNDLLTGFALKRQQVLLIGS